MNKFLLLIGCMIFFLDPVGVVAFAQPPHVDRGIHSMYRARGCSTLESLPLSSDQRNAIKQIETQQKNQILSYQKGLMIKRIELRNLLRDGQISEKFVKQKFEDFETTQRLLSDEMLAYQLEIRRILTPKQLSRWCTLIGRNNSHGGW